MLRWDSLNSGPALLPYFTRVQNCQGDFFHFLSFADILQHTFFYQTILQRVKQLGRRSVGRVLGPKCKLRLSADSELRYWQAKG